MYDKTVILGKNVVIKQNVELHYVTVGDNVVIGKNTTIFGSKEHQVTIGENTYISPNSYFNGAFGLEIAADVTLAAGVMIFSDSGPNRGPLQKIYPTEKAKIIIGYGSWVCAGSILLPGARMDEVSILASNSTLKDHIKKYQVFGGNPAKYIRTETDI